MASANPDLKAIFIDHGNLTSTIPTYMEAAGLAPDSMYAAGFDLSPATVQGVKDGYVDLVIDQQQYLQGFEAIAAALPDARTTASAGCSSTPAAASSTKSNIDVIAPLVEQQIR